MTLMKPRAVGVTLSLCLLALAGCGGATPEDDESGRPSVAAAFYPLEFLVDRVAADRVDIVSLTPAGAEPHDVELTPDALVTLEDADLVVYLAGFQPAVDDALPAGGPATLDLSPLATRATAGGVHAEEDEDAGGEGEHADDGDRDPHFWTDPIVYAEAAVLVADALAQVDPDGATAYRANAETLVGELRDLDDEAIAAFGSCDSTTLVTAHDAFGYFAARYGFEAISIAGISPESEPSAGDLAEVTEAVRDSGVGTIYTETLVSPDVAEVVAAETGARTAVLDPIEGITDSSAGTDYLSTMRANIGEIVTGQGCA